MPSQAHYKTLGVAFMPDAFHISVAHGGPRLTGGGPGFCREEDEGGVFIIHTWPAKRSLPTYFQFGAVFINKLHFSLEPILEDTCHIISERVFFKTLCGKRGGGGRRRRRPGSRFFDKWMSGDEAKISRSMKGERGKKEEH